MDLGNAKLVGVGRASEVYAWGEGRVLKLYRPSEREAWAEHEFRTTAAAHDAGLPAPRVFGLERVGQRLGMVMERVEGPSLLQVLAARPWKVVAVGRRLAEVQAALHAVRMPGLGPLHERLRGWIARAPIPSPLRAQAEAALARMPPGDAVCHGDLHPDNVILTRRGPVVIDWSEAAAGPPLADVVRTSLMLRFASPAQGRLGFAVQAGRRLLHTAWLGRYRRLTGCRAALEPYLLPLAVARAGHGFDDEAPSLRALIERLAAPARGSTGSPRAGTSSPRAGTGSPRAGTGSP